MIKKRTITFNHIVALISFALGASAEPAAGLDMNGNGSLRSEAVVLYTFDEGSGNIVTDKSAIGPALNLTIMHPNNVTWTNNGLSINVETLIRSSGPATKIINNCGNNELTIEAWISNQVQNDFVADLGPLRILTLSRGANQTDFFLGQNYDGNHFYQAAVRTGNNGNFNNDDGDISNMAARVPEGVLRHDDGTPPYQQVFYIRESDGTNRFYVSDKYGIPVAQPTTNFGGNLNLNANSILALGNEINAFNDQGEPLVRGNFTAQDRPWRGTYHMVAVYCRALSREEILGPRAPENWLVNQSFPIDPNDVITEARKKAQLIYRRLVGVTTPIDDPILKQMEADIRAGNDLAAAKRVTVLDGFYNRTVKDFGKLMSNREETVNVPLNDFAAMIVGHTRDAGDARELLYGNFYYQGSIERTAVPRDIVRDILMSNNHYEALENLNYNLADPLVLERVNGQKLYNGAGQVIDHKDPSGLITSRAFMSAHAVAGTNRRLVEFAFREFLCQPIKQWADNTGPDDMVGRDVDRFPGGNHSDYQVTCRGCHSQMDPLRQAFGRVTFENNFVKHTFVVAQGDDEEDPATTAYDPSTLIVEKMNRNDDVFPGGWVTTNTTWFNRSNTGANGAYFEWQSRPTRSLASTDGKQISGKNINDFGHMIAGAGAFPKCMAKRVFRSVCKREAIPSENQMLNAIADKFASEDNFRLKALFERVAVTSECLGSQ